MNIRVQKRTGSDSSLQAGDIAAPDSATLWDRRLFLTLAALAVAFAFLAGMRTVADPDLFWQLATGRWVLQHHHIFSTDVFSYTAQGQPWIYPVGSGLFFYLAYVVGGYVLISWIGAAACAGSVALLLRRNSIAGAGFAIIAVPLIAERTIPRAEMFSVVLFAAFVSVLWQNHRTGDTRLWLLPVLMIAWVNLHPGFVAGLGLIGGFVVVELLELPFHGVRREQAWPRLKRSYRWFVATVVATLMNPWGWGIYSTLLRQNHAMAEHSAWIAEWGSVPLNWAAVASEFSLRYTRGAFYLLLVVGVLAVLLACLQREFGPAFLLLVSLYLGVRHLRLDALCACVVVIVGGSLFSSAPQRYPSRSSPQMRIAAAACIVIAFSALAFLRSVDVVTNHRNHAVSRFGAGLTWWVPEPAASFIEREKLPGQVFNTYNVGGYLVWRLGPERRDYLDGRAIPFGDDIFRHQAELLQASLDSDIWRREAERYDINTILLPLLRYESRGEALKTFCQSAQWRPVYLDQISAIFVRRGPKTEELIKNFPVDCATAPLPVGPLPSSADGLFNAWTNAASVLTSLGRYSEALAALDKAQQIFPDSFFVAGLRGSIFFAMGSRSEAEHEFLKAVSLEPAAAAGWFSLAALYQDQDRTPDSIRAQQRGIDVSSSPQPRAILKLAHLYLETHQPRAALEAFDRALRSAPPDLLGESGPRSFRYDVAVGQASAWRSLGDTKRAAAFDQEAVRDLLPQN